MGAGWGRVAGEAEGLQQSVGSFAHDTPGVSVCKCGVTCPHTAVASSTGLSVVQRHTKGPAQAFGIFIRADNPERTVSFTVGWLFGFPGFHVPGLC